jgi:hypothetical protein
MDLVKGGGCRHCDWPAFLVPHHRRAPVAAAGRRPVVGDGGIIGRGRRRKWAPATAVALSERVLQGSRGGVAKAAGGGAAGAGDGAARGGRGHGRAGDGRGRVGGGSDTHYRVSVGDNTFCVRST